MKKGISFFIGLGVFGATLAGTPNPAYAEGGCFTVGETAYETFSEARNSIEESGTIVLTCDASIDDVTYGLTNKNVVFDLNGHTFEQVATDTSTMREVIRVMDGGTLTIEDTSEAKTGKIVSNLFGLRTVSGGTLIINGGTIDGYYYGVINLAGGTTEINGGTISSPYSIAATNYGTFDVKGGILTTVAETYSTLVNNEGGVMTISGGTITAPNGTTTSVVSNTAGTLNMTGGSIEAESYGIAVWHDGILNISGGEISAENQFAVTGNGTTNPESANYGANTTITISGGEITSNGAAAIYHPQAGTLTINDGIIHGKDTGIEIRSGTMTITGGNISSENGIAYNSGPNGNGSTAAGAAIAVAQHTTTLPINVTISGGNFTGPIAFSEDNPQGNAEEDIEKVTVSITGGIFTATSGDPIVVSEDLTKFISGGQYSKLPATKYIADNYNVYDTSEDGPFFVEPTTAVEFPTEIFLQVGDTYTLEPTDIAKEYLSVGGAADIVSFDSETWTLTATATGTGEFNYNLHNYINPIDENITVAVYSIEVPDESETESASDETIISADVAAAVAEFLEDGSENYFSDTFYMSGLANLKNDFKNGYTIEAGLDIVSGEDYDEEAYSEWLKSVEEELTANAELYENEKIAAVAGANIPIITVNEDETDANLYGFMTELSSPITVEFTIPEEYREAPNGYTRTFYLWRIHTTYSANYETETTYERVDATLSEDGTTLTVSNDKFSAFAITYVDEAIPETPDTGTFTKSDDSAIESKVKTSVILVSAVMMLLGARMMSLGFAGVTRAKNLEK